MKKLTLLLASIGAGLLLVGGTVAAYIVTAADPTNVRVSPGSITTDEYGRVVLSWESNTMHTVQNLDPEEETSVGTVVLAANITKPIAEETTYSGLFSVSIANTSVATHDLKDYLEFKVYKGNPGVAQAKTVGYNGSIVDGDKYSESYPGTNGDQFEVKVTLKASAGDEYYSELLDQAVTVTLGWGAGTGDYDSTDMTQVYYAVPELNSNETLYAHIYEGTKVVSSYPGIKMDREFIIDDNGIEKVLYSASFDKTQFTNFKFIKATTTGVDQVAYTELATASQDFTVVTNKPYYDGDSWESRPGEKVFAYYLRGIINGQEYWNTSSQQYALRQIGNTGVYQLQLELYDGDSFKVLATEVATGVEGWFGLDGVNFDVYVHESGDPGLGWPGFYTIKISAAAGEGLTEVTYNHNEVNYTRYMSVSWAAAA